MIRLPSSVNRSWAARRLSLGSALGAVHWPKPDYGPLDVHRSAFLNGIKVAAAKPEGAQMSACTIMFQAGSRNEMDKTLGASHFIRASSSCSGAAYTRFLKSRYLQRNAGYITCASDRQSVSFTLRCPSPVFEDLKCYLLDTASRCSYFDYELNDTVRRQVMDDLLRRPLEQRTVDLVQKACWGGPLSNSVFCDENRIGSMSEDTLVCYATTFFKTNRCTIASVGLPFEETLKLAEHIEFRTLRPPEYCEMCSFPRGGYETNDLGPGSETCIAVAIPTCGTCDLNRTVRLAVLAEACGTGNVQTGLHSTDRVPQPPLGNLPCDVFTDFKAFNIAYRDAGLFGVLVKCPSESARDAAFKAANFLANVSRISCDEIEVGKRRLKVSLMRQDEECTLAAEGLALQLANGYHMDSVRDSLQMVDCVEAGEVSAAAAQISSNKALMALAVVGDVGAVPHDRELLASCT